MKKVYTFDYGTYERLLYRKVSTTKEGVLELFKEFFNSGDSSRYYGVKEGLIRLNLEENIIEIASNGDIDCVFIVEFEVV